MRALILIVLALGASPAAGDEAPRAPVPSKEQTYSTTMDFDSTMIDGKMKAPNGFLLQGRNKQSLSNMVKLRSNFSTKLGDSKSAVQSLIK